MDDFNPLMAVVVIAVVALVVVTVLAALMVITGDAAQVLITGLAVTPIGLLLGASLERNGGGSDY